jgi:hypothetical protein
LPLRKGERWGTDLRREMRQSERQCTHLAIDCVIVDRETADELPVLVAGYVELALELE